MTATTPRRSAIALSYAAAAAILYAAALSLGAVLIDSSMTPASPGFDRMVRGFAQLAAQLPGVAHWPSLNAPYDADGRFQVLAICPATVLLLAAAACIGRARVLSQQRATDLAEERKELIRIGVRNGRRIH